jgi:hypothetical protein
MDEIIKRISERLSAQSSRRGFFSTLGKAVLGAGAIVSGQSFFAQTAEARTIKCCTGTPCPGNGCPSGTTANYTWSCGGHFYCHDCANSSGAFVCTYFSA